jgi:hypothetical protein
VVSVTPDTKGCIKVVIALHRGQTVFMNTSTHTYTVARTDDGKVDYDAYTNVAGFIEHNDLEFPVIVTSARYRYGHLDLLVTPVGGAGSRWVQRTNVRLVNDPAEVVF